MLPGADRHYMENHSSALTLWGAADATDMVCVHLDAHLDVGWHPESSRVLLDEPVDEWRHHERDCFLHTSEGLYDIANWLGLALARGMVSRLYWVVPDEVWFTSGRQVQDLLLRQVGQTSIDSFAGLADQAGPYTLNVLGVDVVICRLRELPALGSTPVLLDLDLDFFARYRTPGAGQDWSASWIGVDEVCGTLRSRVPNAALTTVSASCHGGFLPSDLRPDLQVVADDCAAPPGHDRWHGRPETCTRAYQDYTWACGLLHRGRPAEALPFARRAVAADPSVGAYRYAHAMSADGVGDQRSAEIAIDACLATGSIESAQVSNDAAGIHSRAGRPGEALASLDTALTLDGGANPVILGNLMSHHAREGDWDSAGEYAHRTLTSQPFNPDAWATLATVHARNGDYHDSAEAYVTAARVTPNEHAAAGYQRRAARLSKRT